MDAFANSVLSRLEPNVRATLSERQLRAIGEALSMRGHGSAHMVDARGVVSLYFAKFYFVFQFGRDRRMALRRLEYERRRQARLVGNVVFFVFAVSPLIVVALVGLYFLKAALGIDLFPNVHLPRLLGLGR